MARIAGVDLPRDKRAEIGLTYIFGIGPTSSKEILQMTGISPDLRIKDLDEAQHISDRIVNTNALYSEGRRTTVLVNAFGSRLRWEDGRLRLNAIAVARENGRMES